MPGPAQENHHSSSNGGSIPSQDAQPAAVGKDIALPWEEHLIDKRVGRDVIPLSEYREVLGASPQAAGMPVSIEEGAHAFGMATFMPIEERSLRREVLPDSFLLEGAGPQQTIDVLRVRNALKLATKFFSEFRLPWSPDCSVPSCSHVAEVGLLLALTKSHPEVVEAGLLYPTFGHEKIESDKAKSVLERKFAPAVSMLVAEINSLLQLPEEGVGQRLLELRGQDPLFAQRLATLHCAVMCARAGGSSSQGQIGALGSVYYTFGAPIDLINQYNIYSGRPSDIIPANQSETSYDLHEIIDIRNALRSAAVVYKDSMRKWGPEEKIPLISHAAEVGLLLVLAGKSRDTIVAGLLHDFLEGYVEDEVSDLSQCVDEYGANVRALVEAITEPERRSVQGKTETIEAWRLRKYAIVERMKGGTEDFADLCAATKISTIAAGNKMLFENGDFRMWSNGPLEENLAVFIKIIEAYGETGKSSLLAGQLELEIDRLILLSMKLPPQPVAEVA